MRKDEAGDKDGSNRVRCAVARHRDSHRWHVVGMDRANESGGRNDGGTVTGGRVVESHPRNPRPLSQQIPPTPVQWRLARPHRPPLPPPRLLPSPSSPAATGQRTSSTSQRPPNSSKSYDVRSPSFRLSPPGAPVDRRCTSPCVLRVLTECTHARSTPGTLAPPRSIIIEGPVRRQR